MPQTPAPVFNHVYGHCVAVLGATDAAAEAAAAALGRGWRGRSSALAWARHEALLRAAGSSDLSELRPTDLNELAVLLSFTRPPVERAVVDLDGRHGLDRAQLGRALGLTPARAAARAAEVGAEWDAALDRVVLAYLGPGECPDFPPVPGDGLGDLMAAGTAVAAHADSCELCGDRRRAIVSVRQLLAQRPLERAPAASAPARNLGLRTFAWPPPLEPNGHLRTLRRLAIVGAAAAMAGFTVLGVTAFVNRGGSGRNDRVRALTKVAASNALQVSQSSSGSNAALANTSGHEVTWMAALPVDWLLVTPQSGRLAPGQTAHITTTVLPTAPEGTQAVTLTITGDDGSAAALRVEAAVNHPPQVGATVDGCTVTATADDDDGIAFVRLHWTDPSGEQAIDLLKGPTGYSAALPQRPTPITWWVVAADTKGNQARTSNHVATACL